LTDYRVIYEDPDFPEEPAKILVPTDEWMELAMSGGLPPISVYWALKADEEQAIAAGTHATFSHDNEKYMLQFTSPRIPPLTEEEAIQYLIMKDIPHRVWRKEHNKQLFKIVKRDQLPTDRTFRDAWKVYNE
jgi:hypothetical protein